MILRTPDPQGIGFAVVFPLVFLAGTFVPAVGMQTAVRTIAEYNPLSAIVTAMRQVTHGTASTGSWPLEHPVPATIAGVLSQPKPWSVVVIDAKAGGSRELARALARRHRCRLDVVDPEAADIRRV
jgi:hypothetical protein